MVTFHFTIGAQSVFLILQLKMGEKQQHNHLRKQDVVPLQMNLCHPHKEYECQALFLCAHQHQTPNMLSTGTRPITRTLKCVWTQPAKSYSVCVELCIQDLAQDTAVFLELFVGVGVALNLGSQDHGSQDSISTRVQWPSWRRSCTWAETDFGICERTQEKKIKYPLPKSCTYIKLATVFLVDIIYISMRQLPCYRNKGLIQWSGVFIRGGILIFSAITHAKKFPPFDPRQTVSKETKGDITSLEAGVVSCRTSGKLMADCNCAYFTMVTFADNISLAW